MDNVTMKSIQELKDDLIKTRSNPPGLYVIVGEEEFDALMAKLGKLERKDQNKDEILAAIDKAKLSILRGMHSGDKVANILVNLVGKVRDNEDTFVWKCPECGADAAWDVDNAADAGTPMCGECDVDMKPDYFLLFDSEEWKEAEAYVLRIKTVRDSKEKT